MSLLKTGLGAVAAAALVMTVATPASAQYRHYHGGGNGAAVAGAAIAGIVGAGIAASAANNYYGGGYGYSSPYDSYASYGGPAYGPGYYEDRRRYGRYGNSWNSNAGPGGYNVPSRY